MKKEIGLPKMPWTVRVPMLAFYALAVLCIAAIPITGDCLFLGLFFLFVGLGLQHGREWMSEALAFFWGNLWCFGVCLVLRYFAELDRRLLRIGFCPSGTVCVSSVL